MIDEFLDVYFGSVRLWCSRVSTVNGRKLVTHSPTTGDDHTVEDEGLEQQVVRCSVLFDDMDGEATSPRERFNALLAMHLEGAEQIFRHPLRGSYRAKIGAFDHELEGAVISAEIEVVPLATPTLAALPAGVATSSPIGEDAVNFAADQADAELGAVGLDSPVTDEARTAVASWQEPDSGVRRVLVDVGLVSERIVTEIERLRLTRSLALWPAHRAMLVLGETFQAAARSQTADVSRLMVVLTGRPISLRKLLANIYGAREVSLRYRQAIDLNDIPTPAWIPQGTQLRLPQPAPQRRAA